MSNTVIFDYAVPRLVWAETTLMLTILSNTFRRSGKKDGDRGYG